MAARAPHGETTAFVFAGGGSLGAIQVGVLRELVAAGVKPDFLVGSSVGALNACYFATRPHAEGVDELEAIWRRLRRQDVFPVSMRGVADWLRGGGSLFNQRGLSNLIERHLPVKRLEDAELPVHVVATNLNGAPVRMSRGPAVEAILASAAIPIAFPSVRIGEDHLIDGAISGNTPILTAAELGATRIVVLQTGYACSMEGPPRSAVAQGLHAITLMIVNQMERDLRLLGGKVTVHVAPHLCPLDVSPFNFEHSAELIQRSAETTRAWLDAGGLAAAATSEAFEHHHGPMRARPSAAAGGFDVVSYFSEGRAPLTGLSDHAAFHNGMSYYFASSANRDLFLSDPTRFAPQYDGFCAYAMARNMEARGDPRIYRVVDGRLYFNLNAEIHEKWEHGLAEAIASADANWRSRVAAAASRSGKKSS